MENLIILGTGNAMVTKCYNTCFAIDNGEEYFMVDAGGGNGILRQIQDAGMDAAKIHHIFLTHEHTDHLLGMIWMIRKVASLILQQKYEGNLMIYCHDELVHKITAIAEMTMQKKFTNLFGERVLFVTLADGDSHHILDYDVHFFDIHSTKAKQFGFYLELKNGERLVCAGDEPLPKELHGIAADCGWLMHEAFCLYSERHIFKPYEKHHSTVKDACEMAESLNIRNLILYHTEDRNIESRKELYSAEGALYYQGNLYIPDDLEVISLS